MAEAKPFDISKRDVWDAFKRVKANRGAVGGEILPGDSTNAEVPKCADLRPMLAVEPTSAPRR